MVLGREQSLVFVRYTYTKNTQGENVIKDFTTDTKIERTDRAPLIYTIAIPDTQAELKPLLDIIDSVVPTPKDFLDEIQGVCRESFLIFAVPDGSSLTISKIETSNVLKSIEIPWGISVVNITSFTDTTLNEGSADTLQTVEKLRQVMMKTYPSLYKKEGKGRFWMVILIVFLSMIVIVVLTRALIIISRRRCRA
jgi:hypothetical protein